MTRRGALLACAIGLAACVSHVAPTEVVVVVSAEPTIVRDARSLHVVVSGGPAGGLATRADQTLTAPIVWPVHVAIVPASNDAQRVYEVEATALMGTAVVGRVRAISGFLAQQTLHLSLTMEDCCTATAATCSADQTCRSCSCVSATIDPHTLVADAGPPAGDAAPNPSDTYVADAPDAAVPARTLCVTNYNTGALLTFRESDSGDVAPQRSAGGSLNGTQRLAVDLTHREIFVAYGANSVAVLSLDGGTLLRSITGSATMLMFPTGVAVDVAADEIFVASRIDSTVYVFARTATGNAAPLRSFTAGNLSLPEQIALGPGPQELTVVSAGTASIHVHARTASGAVTALRILGGPATTMTSGIKGIELDLAHGELHVTDRSTQTVLTFPSSVPNGNVTPTRVLSASDPYGVVTDSTTGETFVTEFNLNTIAVFAAGAMGSATPVRTIVGAATTLSSPLGIAFCD